MTVKIYHLEAQSIAPSSPKRGLCYQRLGANTASTALGQPAPTTPKALYRLCKRCSRELDFLVKLNPEKYQAAKLTAATAME